jgi:hypothetical protein
VKFEDSGCNMKPIMRRTWSKNKRIQIAKTNNKTSLDAIFTFRPRDLGSDP